MPLYRKINYAPESNLTDSYDLWRAELAEPTPESDRHTRVDTPELIAGFWRILAARTKPSYPVAIWPENGASGPAVFFKVGVGKRDGESLFNTVTDADRVGDFQHSSWLKCIAVSEADYHAAMASGRWADGQQARQMSDIEKLDLVPDTPASEGGNNPVGEDGQPIDLFHEQVTTKIAAALDKAKALPFPLTTLEDAQKGAEIIETLTGLGKQGEAKRKIEKQPHIEAAAAVDQKWSLVRDASEMIAKLKAVIETFKRAETERQRREAAEAAEVERKRLQKIADDEAEERRVALQKQLDDEAAQRGESAEQVVVEAEQVEVAPAPVVEPVRVSTPHGRAVSTPKTKTATITDLRALSEHFIHAADADFVDYLQKRVNAAARAKITLPGTRIDP